VRRAASSGSRPGCGSRCGCCAIFGCRCLWPWRWAPSLAWPPSTAGPMSPPLRAGSLASRRRWRCRPGAAVADAAREGTRLAVKDAVIEIVTDPTLRARLHQATAPEPGNQPARTANQPGFWARLKAHAARAAHAVGQSTCNVVRSAASVVKRVAANAIEAVRSLGRFSGLKRLALAGLGTGIAFAITAIIAPRAVAATLSAASSAVAAAAVKVGLWTRRTVRTLAVV
jgi:hypothetical protein